MRLALVFLMATLVPAEAGLDVCNTTARPVKVALGRFNGANWMSEGWWNIAPKTCAAVVSQSLNAHFYYLFATDGGSGSWDGTHGFCVSAAGKFAITGRRHCLAHGFERKGFFEVDTGSEGNYTQTISD